MKETQLDLGYILVKCSFMELVVRDRKGGKEVVKESEPERKRGRIQFRYIEGSHFFGS